MIHLGSWEHLIPHCDCVLVTISKDHGKQGLRQRMLIFSPTKKAKKIPGSIGRGHKRKEFLWGYPYNSRGLFFKSGETLEVTLKLINMFA